ncbi:DUF420 domain-containing protein [Marinoscillum sp. MHG1-6]|uniref:DUF420 domain-containing protein n=1 Tax=Marinoscillum sp. MHG1-6 TaxID=2959627 RepID=UPI0021573570|nr:DUF420 domain-containing protein [Marinoscillum sp. MHG1-6]
MKENKVYLRIIIAISIAIPLVVAILLYSPLDLGLSGDWIKALPKLNALLNSTTSVLLILALIAIRKRKVSLHKKLMLSCLVLGTLFLVSYVVYHSNSTSVIFGDSNKDGILSADELLKVGALRTIYVFTLLSHIGLSFVVVPFVLLAFYFALTDQITRHKKIVKFTFPVWLYVSVTGVIVYLLISPYYL